MTLFFDQSKKLELREYQREARDAVCAALDAGEKPLLIMATGTGKTIVFSAVHERFLEARKRSLIVAHRDELIDQAISKIGNQTGYMPAKEKAGESAELTDPIVVGSVQTMQRKRLERWPENHFSLVTIDEAHHAAAVSYQNIIKRFSSAGLLGVTATPDRADEKQMGDTFTKIAYQYPLHRAIKEKNLVPIIGRRVKDFDIDLSGLSVVAGDYSDSELAAVVEKFINPMAHSIQEQTEGLKTLVFMPNVESSRLMSEGLAALGVKAKWISGGTDMAERRSTLYQFSQGIITHLVSCNVILEGYDEPSVEAIVMGRPTASRALYAQAVGRGTRLYPGKERLLLVEFTYNSSRLKLVSAYELFSTMGFGERVQDRAVYAETGTDVDFLSALEDANKKFYDMNEIIKRLPVRRLGFVEFDPMAIGDLIGVDVTGEFDISWNGHKLTGQATEKQKELLRRYNISNVDTLGKAQASALIDALMSKGFMPMQGIATPAQIQYLRRLGLPIRDEQMTKAQAGMMISLMK